MRANEALRQIQTRIPDCNQIWANTTLIDLATQLALGQITMYALQKEADHHRVRKASQDARNVVIRHKESDHA